MGKKVALFLGGVILFAFIFVASIAWSKIFYGASTPEEITTLSIKMSPTGNQVDANQNLPSEEVTSEVVPYSFKVTNTSNKDGHYQILLEEDPISNKVGYRQEDLLTRNQLNYQLLLNGVVIKKGRLSSIKNNILDDRIIEGKQENQYILKIWVHDKVKAGEWENKYYHYKVTSKIIGE